MHDSELKFVFVSHRDELLSKVIALGTQNSRTLGMFPEGAFMDHARKKTIIAALFRGEFAGYLLYRISHSKRLVSVTHLCIQPEFRGRSIPKKLLEQLKTKYENTHRAIALTCREDYVDASKLWRSFGFKAVDRRLSKSKDEHYLVKWHYDFGNPDLFTLAQDNRERMAVLLDCSVITK